MGRRYLSGAAGAIRRRGSTCHCRQRRMRAFLRGAGKSRCQIAALPGRSRPMSDYQETLYQGYGQRFSIDNMLHEVRTEHQHLVIFENARMGRVMALDGDPDHRGRRVHLPRDAHPRADPRPRRGPARADHRRRRRRYAARGQAQERRADHHGRDRRHRGRHVQGVPAQPLPGRLRRPAAEPGDRRRHALRGYYGRTLRRDHLRLHRPDRPWRGAVLRELLPGLPALPERGWHPGHPERHAVHATGGSAHHRRTYRRAVRRLAFLPGGGADLSAAP